MKKSKLLLISGIIGTIYLIYLIFYFSNGVVSTDGVDAIGAGLAAALVMPHMVCVAIAVIFNWLGWALEVRWGALVAGIMYAVSMVCMFLYAVFVLIEMILCFIAFAKMKQESEKKSIES
ncbi:hypothetical protein EXD82_08105 [Peptacetobacter hominis]|uniref:Uncharacterized protein n=1 Tax=Peptacetobacter hominis TaxID=2743610 RepID=A0A544QU13_9FIRM|nr:hypothetical protein [Peptacetobacter hominis]TQQ84162.1 hypothetical protein EXD82_08105 [Peptacetobacter hominis]